MVAGVAWWQWLLASLVVPVVVGLGSAYIGHVLQLRRARFDLRIVSHRATYETLLPALDDLVAYEDRWVRRVYSDYPSQAAMDMDLELDNHWESRRHAAWTVIEGVLLRGELAASRAVIAALEQARTEHATIRQALSDEDLDYPDAVEAAAASSRKALAAVRRLVDRES